MSTRAIWRITIMTGLVAFGLGAFAPAAIAGTGLPVRGQLTGSTTGQECGPQFCLTGRDTGQATRFGAAVLDKQVVATPTDTPCDGGFVTRAVETSRLTAANGDQLDLKGSGLACHGPTGTTASLTLTPTGGTGRFADTGGSLTETVRADAQGAETVSLSGSLSS